MITPVKIVDRSDEYPVGLAVQCQQVHCKRPATLSLKVLILGEIWQIWSCTADSKLFEATERAVA